ncbi:hypothetical protein P280DRAFT_520048 [Massarina eburnea CBS 473.64]|uniref:Uncharacterized protein n=1 Tax=Massarina eburnea CBS 473.64 TaxID=1395130 RepID=A0A6A6RSY5_9PLEO|nr:hypothetical protein P280DRAFT_520048 [Massarina eburnea CBS 473.64]
MRLSTIFTTLIVSVSALTITPRGNAPKSHDNTCFSMEKGVCMGYNADAANATTIIKLACEQVTSCTPGVVGNRPRVTGKTLGFPYTATLYVGDQCGGTETWSTEACVDLFNVFVEERCEKQFPHVEGMFQLGYQTAPCDGSFVSFNFGG